jgi:hypothetical protein
VTCGAIYRWSGTDVSWLGDLGVGLHVAELSGRAHRVPADDDVAGLLVEEHADRVVLGAPLASTVAGRPMGWAARRVRRCRRPRRIPTTTGGWPRSRSRLSVRCTAGRPLGGPMARLCRCDQPKLSISGLAATSSTGASGTKTQRDAPLHEPRVGAARRCACSSSSAIRTYAVTCRATSRMAWRGHRAKACRGAGHVRVHRCGVTRRLARRPVGTRREGLRPDRPGREGTRRLDGQTLHRVPRTLETVRPGVFAVGDVRSGSIKRVASAVGKGAMAVRLVHEHLEDVGGAFGRDRGTALLTSSGDGGD